MTTLQTDGAADPLPFVALSDFKAALSIADNDTSQDGVLTNMLLAASSAVQSYIGRQITVADWTHRIRIRHGDRRLSLSLGVHPVLSVAGVFLDGQSLQAPAEGWDFDPLCGILYPPIGPWWWPCR